MPSLSRISSPNVLQNAFLSDVTELIALSLQTWVGNKRRKLASKVPQNGGVSHSLSSHGLAGGMLSNHTLAGGALSNHSLAVGALLPADMTAARSIQNRVHLLPPSSSFPSVSSTPSPPSSSSPLSSGSNNNNDVILTGIYSLNPGTQSRPRAAAPPPQSDSDLSAHTSSSLMNQVLQIRNSSSSSSPVHSKLVSLSQNLPSLTSASGPLVYTAVRKGALSLGEGGVSAGAGVVPHSWTRQYGTAQIRPWSSSSQSQTQLQPRPHSNPQPQPPAPQKTRVSLPVHNAGPSSDQTPRIQQVFTLSEKGDRDRLRPGPKSARKSQETHRSAPLDTSHNFSIAMETGDEEDEWQREEELANMAAQTHIHREQTSASPIGAEVSVVRGNHTPPMTSSRSALLQGSYSLTAQTSLTGESSSQVGAVLLLVHSSL